MRLQPKPQFNVRPLLLLSLVAVLLVPATSSAQTQVGLGLGYSIVSGDNFENVDPGLTLGGHFAFGVFENAQIGVGFDFSPLSINGTDEKIRQIDVLAMARYLFQTEPSRFFLGAKGGYTRQSETTLDLVITGFAIGPTVGFQIPMGSVVMEWALDGTFHFQGDVSVSGTTVPDTDTNGFRLVPRIGIAIPIGG